MQRPHVGGRGILENKLQPGLAAMPVLPARLERRLERRPRTLVLVHAAAGYGKTAALAATQRRGWLWYNLDRSDSNPHTLAVRLSRALGVERLPSDLAFDGKAVAPELARRLEGPQRTITFDRYEQLGDAGEVGRLLGELLELLPSLCLRVATRARPAMPLERLRLEGRMIESGPAELRLDRERIATLLAEVWERPATAAELDFADRVIGGWPAALHLWHSALEPGGDLLAPLRAGSPLHDYMHEEVLGNTLSPPAMEALRSNPGWLIEPGPLLARATTPERRWLLDELVRHRVGVISEAAGWCPHPLFRHFLEMHAPFPRSPLTARGDAGARLRVRTLGGLSVTVDEQPVDPTAWPAAARRLFELLLSTPGYQMPAQRAAQLLWPRHLARSALNSLNVALHGLRRALEPELRTGSSSRFVVREGRTGRLRIEAMECDLEDMESLLEFPRAHASVADEESAGRLGRALALYGGDFLAGSAEEFVTERRLRLRRMVAEALERLGEWRAASGDTEGALAAFQTQLDMTPQREDIWARLLELLLVVGDDRRALAALQRCEQSLSANGTEPSGLLRELSRRIRA
jgi:DNA-binding SARP family transcriptional activator